jgi:hypothetical protein
MSYPVAGARARSPRIANRLLLDFTALVKEL